MRNGYLIMYFSTKEEQIDFQIETFHENVTFAMIALIQSHKPHGVDFDFLQSKLMQYFACPQENVIPTIRSYLTEKLLTYNPATKRYVTTIDIWELTNDYSDAIYRQINDQLH